MGRNTGIFKTKLSHSAISKRQRKIKNPIRFKAQTWRSMLRFRSKNSNIPFDENITIDFLEELLIKTEKCPCCKKNIDLLNKKQRINTSPSIDKLIPDKGYTVNNISLICWRCNNLKRDSSPSELRMIADWIEKRMKSYNAVLTEW